MLLNVEGSCFYFLMLKVIDLTLGCSKFLLLVLDVESSYSNIWILKVLTFVVFLLWGRTFIMFNPSTSKLCIQGKCPNPTFGRV